MVKKLVVKNSPRLAMPEIEFRFRSYFHPLAVVRLRRLFERSQWFTPGEMQDFQAKRLRAVMERAYRMVPYYREIFRRHGLVPGRINQPRDLALLPSLTKPALRENQTALTARDAQRYEPRPTHSSGTTSEPVSFLLDRHSRVLEFVYYWRHWSWAGYRLGQRFAQLNAQEFIHDPNPAVFRFQPAINRLLLNSGALSEATAAQMADALRRYRPRFLKGLAGPLYYLALLFEARGVRDLNLKAVFSTGEMLYPGRRRLIEEVFHCPVLDSYGLMEQVAGIAQCERGGYHLNGDYALVEFVDESTAGGPAGLCSVLGTTLYNRAMPLIRYRTGDLVQPAPAEERCRCGRTLPLVRAIHGRREDAVITRDGRFVTALFLVPEQVAGARVVQFVQHAPDRLTALVVATERFDLAEEDKFFHYTRKLVGDDIHFEIARVNDGEITRGPTGKAPLVISSLPAARAES